MASDDQQNYEALFDELLSSEQHTDFINLIQDIQNHLNTEQNVDSIQITITVLKRLRNNVGRFSSCIPGEAISVLFDVVSGVMSILPFPGPLIGKVFGLFSYVFGKFGNEGENMSRVVHQVIEDALSQFKDTALEDKAIGIRRAFALSSAFLSGMDGGDSIERHEIASISGHVPVYQGVEYLSILGSKLKEYTLISGQHEKALCFIKLYCELAFLRYAIFYQMYSIIRSTGHSETLAKSIMKSINCEKDVDRSVLCFLTKPELHNVVFFSKVNFGDERLRSLRIFIQFIGLKLQNLSYLTQGEYTMNPIDWDHRKLYESLSTIALAKEEPDITGAIAFTETEEDNVFYMNTRANPERKLYMVWDPIFKLVRGTTDHKKGAEKWKVVQLQDGTYMLSNARWADWFMYMVDTPAGFVRGYKGIPPEQQGIWRIERFG